MARRRRERRVRAWLRASRRRRAARAHRRRAPSGERRQALARLRRCARLEPLDAVRVHRVLLAPLGVERDRVRRARLPARLPQPRHRPSRALGGRRLAGRAMRSLRYTYASVRARNESAWLLPNDGSRTNHKLRADMRRYADGDEVDLVVVGAGAGGSVLTQRLARAGWRVVWLDARPFW